MCGLYTLQRKSLPFPPKLVEVLRHKHWQDRNLCVHPTDVQAFAWWQCYKCQWQCYVRRRFDQWGLRSRRGMDTLEWLSMQNVPVLPLALLFVRPGDYSRLRAILSERMCGILVAMLSKHFSIHVSIYGRLWIIHDLFVHLSVAGWYSISSTHTWYFSVSSRTSNQSALISSSVHHWCKSTGKFWLGCPSSASTISARRIQS